MTSHIFKFSALSLLSMVGFMSAVTAGTLIIHNKNIPDKVPYDSDKVTPYIIVSTNNAALKLPTVGSTSANTISNERLSITLAFGVDTPEGLSLVRSFVCGPWGGYFQVDEGTTLALTR